MARVFITGSADGLGRAAAQTLLNDGHEVVVHARNRDRLTAVRDLLDRGAAAVVGDLSHLEETRGLARDVNRLGRLDAVIHNAGVYTGRRVLPVNVVASYLLSALIDRPQRLVYLSSSEHRSGRPSLTGIDWSGRRTTGSYPDSKLFVTTLTVAVARRWAEVFSNAVDPGWVPTKMGGPGAPGNLRLGHLTQEWPATSDDPEARTPAATGITSAGPSRIPPSVTGGSRTNCSRTWLASPLRASSDSCRIALSWSCETVVADGDLLGQAHVSTMLSMHKRS